MSITTPTAAAVAPTAKTAPDLSDIGDPTKTPDHDVTFSEVLSTLNPLQYIPVIGSIYRAVTGDTISQAAQVVGGTLLGGPMGLIASAANAVLAQSTGKDVGDRLVAWLTPGSDSPTPAAPQIQYAANSVAAPAAAAAPSATTSPQTAAAVPADAAPPVAAAAQPAAPSSGSAAAQPAATPAPAAQDAGAALLPRTVAGTSGPASPGATTALAGAAGASKGWGLADYRTFAGHGLPPSAGANGAQLRTTPVPLQTTMPLPNDTGRAPVVPAAAQTQANATPAAAAPATPQPQDTWVSEAMMRGLDRYRAMMRQQQQSQTETGAPKASE